MRYISLLRGINVGGHKKIKMLDLKALYLSLNFTEVITYIQSGNVIFTTPLLDEEKISTLIADAIQKRYGFDVPIIIRTAEVWEKVISRYPFSVDPIENATTVCLILLSKEPNIEDVTTLQSFVMPPDQLHVEKNNIYLSTPNGYGKTKLSNNFIEKKLEVKATTRNWKSILKIRDLSRDKVEI